MNILRIIYDFADKDVQSAGLSPGPYELTLAQGKRETYKIFVLTGNLNGKNLRQAKFKYTLCDGRVVVYNLPRAVGKFGPFLTSSLCVIPMYFYLKIFKGIDVVHNQQQMGVWFLLYKYLFGFIDKTPVVHSNHGPILAREEKIKEQGAKLSILIKYFEYSLHKLSDYLSVKVSDTIVAVSLNVKEDLERYYKILKPIVVVENGVNVDKFKPDGEKINFGFREGAIILGNGGRLSKRKNVDLIVESLQYLDENYVLTLWGKWDEDLKKKVGDFIVTHNLGSRVKYLGEVSYWEVDKYFRALNVFLLPSVHEGLPKVVLEAIASGNKVAASGFNLRHRIPCLTYLQDLSSQGIASAIKQLTKTTDGNNASIEIVKEFYSWDKKVDELDAVYRDVISKR